MRNMVAVSEEDWDRVVKAVRYIEELRGSANPIEKLGGPITGLSNTTEAPILTPIEITSSTPISTGRWEGVFSNINYNIATPSSTPTWETTDTGYGCHVIALNGESLTSGRYIGFPVGQIDADTGPNPIPLPVFAAIAGGSGGIGTSFVHDIVHVVKGPTYDSDPTDWFCVRVYRDSSGTLLEEIPRVLYGQGATDGTSGYVTESCGRRPKLVDINDETGTTVTHAIPLYKHNGDAFPDVGDQYFIYFPLIESFVDFQLPTGFDPDLCDLIYTTTRLSIDTTNAGTDSEVVLSMEPAP